ncbi:unnamed protein product [marine sediment metagenome]|uniref:Uncharacterized protein n=1 Tax=marine sediment metagenome TaxID=412755 RepID=X1MGS3_9ZZZZ
MPTITLTQNPDDTINTQWDGSEIYTTCYHPDGYQYAPWFEIRH